MFRAVGPISNMPEFFEAFEIKEGDPMWRKPEARVKIW
jgi:predicted metalloendopeptidase